MSVTLRKISLVKSKSEKMKKEAIVVVPLRQFTLLFCIFEDTLLASILLYLVKTLIKFEMPLL